jgi:hypothetical protein
MTDEPIISIREWLQVVNESAADPAFRARYVARMPRDVVPMTEGIAGHYPEPRLALGQTTANDLLPFQRIVHREDSIPDLPEEENFVVGLRRFYMPVGAESAAAPAAAPAAGAWARPLPALERAHAMGGNAVAFDVGVLKTKHRSFLQPWAVPTLASHGKPIPLKAIDLMFLRGGDPVPWSWGAFIHPFVKRDPFDFPFQPVPENAWGPPMHDPHIRVDSSGRPIKDPPISHDTYPRPAGTGHVGPLSSFSKGGKSRRSRSRVVGGRQRRSSSRAAGGRRRGHVRGASRRRSGASRRRRP